MTEKIYFTRDTFTFLEELKKNNSRDWFQANKKKYEEKVRFPLIDFIQDFSVPLRKISSHFIADPRLVGGSMFRISRDVRFSSDKSPYKTNAGAHFRHEAGKNAHAPGYYLHIEPGNVFAGAGIWRPDNNTLTQIREMIVAEPKEWTKSLSGKAMKNIQKHEGESLKNPPKGFDPDHPLISDLKQKDFAVSSSFTDSEACSRNFLEKYTRFCHACIPYMRFLTQALKLPF